MNQKTTCIQQPRYFHIVSTGICLGHKKVSDLELDEIAKFPSGTILKHTGVQYRYHALDQNTPQMAAAAVLDAVKEANWKLTDIDVIISAGAIPFQMIPCNAIHIQRELGLENSGISCFDINATCLGFFAACDLISYTLAQPTWKKVVIVNSEIASAGLNPKDPETFGLFGDAAVAVCVERGNGESRICASLMESYSAHADSCTILGGGTRLPAYHYSQENNDKYLFKMNGVDLFKKSILLLPGIIQKVFSAISPDQAEHFCPKNLSEIDCVIPHQASVSALKLMRRRLNVDNSKWVQIVQEYGNCISASIPLALHLARVSGQLKRGMKVILLGTGAGLSLSAMVLRF